jgi:hypothetical protein
MARIAVSVQLFSPENALLGANIAQSADVSWD